METPDLNWNSLAMEMRGNIRVGLDAGACVAGPRVSNRWNPRLAMAFASLLLLTRLGFLFTDSESKTTQARLKAILEAKNWLELAERDLKLRVPGEFLGDSQTGFPDTAMSGLQDIQLVVATRREAVALLEADPLLKNNELLKKRLDGFQKEIHLE